MTRLFDKKIFFVSLVFVAIYFVAHLYLLNIDRNFDLDQLNYTAYPVHDVDSAQFFGLAEIIKETGAFVSENGEPEIFRTPIYPFLIALFSNHLIIFQIALLYPFLFLIYKMGVAIKNETTGLAAAVLFGLSLSSIFHSLVLLTDWIFSFLLLLSIYLMFFAERKNGVNFLLSGLALSAAILTRPVGLYLIIPVAIILLFYEKRWASILVFLIGTQILVAPWVMRNFFQSKYFGISAISNYNVFFFNIPQYLVYQYGESSEQYQNWLNENKRVSPTQFQKSDLVLYQKVNKEFLKREWPKYSIYHLAHSAKLLIASNFRYVAQQFRILEKFSDNTVRQNLIELLLKFKIKEFFHNLGNEWLLTANRLWIAFVSLFAVIGLIVGLFKGPRKYFLLFGFLIIYFCLITGPVVIARYRLPIDPYLVILFAYGLFSLPRRQN